MLELDRLSSRSLQVLADVVIVGVCADPDDLRSVRMYMDQVSDELDRLRKLFDRLPGLVEDAGVGRDVAAFVRRCNRLIVPAGQHGLDS